jgi:uncharacterized protein (DUF433 family)
MPTAVAYPHLVKDAKKGMMIEGTRYRVRHLVIEHLEYGWSAEELQRNHAELPMSAIYSALAYYYDHQEEMDREIEELARAEEQWRKRSKQPSRATLLRRLARR